MGSRPVLPYLKPPNNLFNARESGLDLDLPGAYCRKKGGRPQDAVMLLSRFRACCLTVLLGALSVSAGCGWNRRNGYAYAPPYAPPVYPQPGLPSQPVPAQAVAYPAAPVQAPVAPGTVLPVAPAGVPMTAPTTIVPTSATTPCPPTCDPCIAPNGVTPTVYEGAVQTAPCVPVQ